jgi:membrane-bound lytic murein transglycosylase A
MTGGWGAFLGTGRVGCAALMLLAAIGGAQAERPQLKIADAQMVPVVWQQIDGWADDDHEAAFATFLISCKAILSGARGARPGRPMYAALHDVCRKAVELTDRKPGDARTFFEKNFRPVRISPLGDPDGFITGYYEPIVEGTRSQGDGYDHPLYRRPPNLSAGRMAVASATASKKGKKKVRKRKSVPFYERAAIDDGALAGRNLEICWLKDPIDSFFAHIQGSVRVRLADDGETLRLNYTAANGHPYVAVGKFLIARNIISKEEMSMDRIREWMERNPEEGKDLRRKNKSYVFFRETNLASNEEPTGAQGISLTPGRSIAVDRNLHVYGTPFFISGMLPLESEQTMTPFRRLMIAQDTGGAIIGPARADLYFGAGDEAGSVSGRLRHNGRFVMLVPNGLFSSAPEEVPLPRPRPKTLDAVAAKTDKPAAPEPAAKPDVKTTASVAPADKADTKKPEGKKPAARKEAKATVDKDEGKKADAKKTDTKKTDTKKKEAKAAVDRDDGKKPEAKKKREAKEGAPKKDATNDKTKKGVKKDDKKSEPKRAVFDRHDTKTAEAADDKPAKKSSSKSKPKSKPAS